MMHPFLMLKHPATHGRVLRGIILAHGGVAVSHASMLSLSGAIDAIAAVLVLLEALIVLLGAPSP